MIRERTWSDEVAVTPDPPWSELFTSALESQDAGSPLEGVETARERPHVEFAFANAIRLQKTAIFGCGEHSLDRESEQGINRPPGPADVDIDRDPSS